MSEFKGTPGPWYIDVNGVEARWNVDDVNGNSVALTHQLPDDKDWAKRDANTRLIAAAPELLEALQFVVDYHFGKTATAPAYLKAKAAITKALGK